MSDMENYVVGVVRVWSERRADKSGSALTLLQANDVINLSLLLVLIDLTVYWVSRSSSSFMAACEVRLIILLFSGCNFNCVQSSPLLECLSRIYLYFGSFVYHTHC